MSDTDLPRALIAHRSPPCEICGRDGWERFDGFTHVMCEDCLGRIASGSTRVLDAFRDHIRFRPCRACGEPLRPRAGDEQEPCPACGLEKPHA